MKLPLYVVNSFAESASPTTLLLSLSLKSHCRQD